MKTSWTKGLTPDQTTELRKDFVGSIMLRNRLAQLSREKIETYRKATISKDGYANPAWAYQQADAVGYERALQEVISLLLDDK